MTDEQAREELPNIDELHKQIKTEHLPAFVNMPRKLAIDFVKKGFPDWSDEEIEEFMDAHQIKGTDVVRIAHEELPNIDELHKQIKTEHLPAFAIMPRKLAIAFAKKGFPDWSDEEIEEFMDAHQIEDTDMVRIERD